jgi:hypothetical protein
MATINQSSGQGALFELVARGQKDAYFVKDDPASTFTHDARYKASTPHLAERRTTVPITRTNFGTSFEVEIDAYGDILTECYLEIEMPSWLPPLPYVPGGQPSIPEIANGLYPITDTATGYSYGYVNYVGYFLFESIQFYQDQFLLQEWTGDGLLVKQLTEGSWNSSFLQQFQGGQRSAGTSVRDIQLRATPGKLRIRLPLPGTQCPGDGGFPLVAMSWQNFRIKGVLRKLEDLVVCNNASFKPAPWNIDQMQYTFDDGSVQTFVPKDLLDIGQPTILLSTVQHYVSPSVQQALRDKPIEIPFRKQFENRFTFGELDFIPLDKGGVAAVTRRLDGRHPTERLFWFFRSQNALDNNRLDNFYNDYFDYNPITAAQPYTNPYGEFYYDLKMNIAGKEREDLHEPYVWNTINSYAKEEKGTQMHIGCMKWSIGEQYGTVYPAPRQPEGTVNFTTADRPTMYIELANVRINTTLGQRKAEMRAYTEGWNVYVVEGGRGRLMFAN